MPWPKGFTSTEISPGRQPAAGPRLGAGERSGDRGASERGREIQALVQAHRQHAEEGVAGADGVDHRHVQRTDAPGGVGRDGDGTVAAQRDDDRVAEAPRQRPGRGLRIALGHLHLLRQRLRLVLVEDEDRDVGEQARRCRHRRGEVEEHAGTRLPGAGGQHSVLRRRYLHLEDDSGRRPQRFVRNIGGARCVVGTERAQDLVLAFPVDGDEGRAGRLRRGSKTRNVDALGGKPVLQLLAKSVLADAAEEGDLGTGTHGSNGLVRALAAGKEPVCGRHHGLARAWQAIDVEDEVGVDRAEDEDGHRPPRAPSPGEAGGGMGWGTSAARDGGAAEPMPLAALGPHPALPRVGRGRGFRWTVRRIEVFRRRPATAPRATAPPRPRGRRSASRCRSAWARDVRSGSGRWRRGSADGRRSRSAD